MGNAPRRPKGLPKTGGRQKGTRNKVTVEIREAARALLDRPAYRASLRRRLDKGLAQHMEALLHHYAYGKPKEQHEVTGAGGGPLDIRQIVLRVPGDESPK